MFYNIFLKKILEKNDGRGQCVRDFLYLCGVIIPPVRQPAAQRRPSMAGNVKLMAAGTTPKRKPAPSPPPMTRP